MFCLLLWCPVKFDLVHVPLIFTYFKFSPHVPFGSCSYIVKQDARVREPGLYMNFDVEMKMNKWKKYYRLANQTGKTRTFQRDVLDPDCIMLQSSVVASFLFL